MCKNIRYLCTLQRSFGGDLGNLGRGWSVVQVHNARVTPKGFEPSS